MKKFVNLDNLDMPAGNPFENMGEVGKSVTKGAQPSLGELRSNSPKRDQQPVMMMGAPATTHERPPFNSPMGPMSGGWAGQQQQPGQQQQQQQQQQRFKQQGQQNFPF